jgi:hypothetical protein
MLVEKEYRTIDTVRFSQLWTKSTSIDGLSGCVKFTHAMEKGWFQAEVTFPRYRHVITSTIQTEPPAIVPGGILADGANLTACLAP